MISSSSAAAANNNGQTHPEGRYKLQYEKTHPAALLHYAHGKTITQVTLAQLKDKPSATATPTSSSLGVSSGVRSAAARFLGTGNGSRALSFVGGNGGSKSVSGANRAGLYSASTSNNLPSNSNFDAKGTYLIFNVGDTVFISDLNSQDKDPIKSIHFSNSNPVCHAFDEDSKDGHDLLIGLASGDVYSVSLRQQLQDVGKKLVGAQHYNKDGCVNSSRCNSIAWVPSGDGTFIVAYADGNLYVYEKNKEGSGDPSFPIIKDQTQFSVAHARNSKNPIARWHICEGSVNSIAFSRDGAYIATVGRDGYLRIFDYKNEQLICGGKSYYGALLCCSWSMDGKYILTGGEDDLVQVWSMDDRKIIAWGEGHNSWVSGVAFDSYWSAPNADGIGENVVYRFGSVGQESESEEEEVDEVDDDNEEEHDHEVEVSVKKEPIVEKHVEAPKDTDRQLSKKELKEKELADFDAVPAEFGYPTSEASGQEEPRGVAQKIENPNADAEKKENNAPGESKNAKKKKKKDKASKRVKNSMIKLMVLNLDMLKMKLLKLRRPKSHLLLM